MAERAWPLWLFTIALIIGYPIISDVYFTAMARDGAYPVDADSIAIPIMSNLIAAVVLAPFILGVTWLCLRGHSRRSRFLAWRSDRPIRSFIATAIFLPLALLAGWTGISFLLDQRVTQEWLWVAYFFGWAFWALAMRAAAIDGAAC